MARAERSPAVCPRTTSIPTTRGGHDIEPITSFIHRLLTRSLQADYDDVAEGRRTVDNVDAFTAARSEHGLDPFGAAGGIPPNYLDAYDDGRPRK
jgi:hypothetical protein